MLETMYSENGIGLAATQVNVHKRVIVMDISEERNEPRVFINPEFEIKSNKSLYTFSEGCLSVPGFNEEITRPDQIILKMAESWWGSIRRWTRGLVNCMYSTWNRSFRRQTYGRLFINIKAR